MNREEWIVDSIEQDLRLQKEAGLLDMSNLGSEWSRRILFESPVFIGDQIRIKQKDIRDFRKKQVFLGDLPLRRQGIFRLISLIDGARRGHKRMLKESFRAIASAGFLDLLQKYPCSKTGNPTVFHYQGCCFSLLWLKHIYSLGLFRKFIEPRAKLDATVLDLGSSCGIFCGLVKMEMKASHHLLVDLPQQLSLAHYYLALEFPQAAIATYKDLQHLKTIGTDFIKKYDFVLVPPQLYSRLSANSVDIFTNFMSLQEMSREYFDHYLKQEPFLSAEIFFTINRYQSAHTYDNGLTIDDYPLRDFIKLYFSTTPLFNKRYKRLMFLFYRGSPYPSEHFEFIGTRFTHIANTTIDVTDRETKSVIKIRED